ncbi:hypothetical protein OAN307_c33190 [Octadecabacter antarcticus 307]|uniref:Uncharacterized protein n=1 Tax=Octadecabacter antarcticus 307 TaxID=391626 RepID=M9R9E1_9RHOB|nr:hypothetical protein OAN307_c33190 [Octadecabacter antarcticus 307]
MAHIGLVCRCGRFLLQNLGPQTCDIVKGSQKVAQRWAFGLTWRQRHQFTVIVQRHQMCDSNATVHASLTGAVTGLLRVVSNGPRRRPSVTEQTRLRNARGWIISCGVGISDGISNGEDALNSSVSIRQVMNARITTATFPMLQKSPIRSTL